MDSRFRIALVDLEGPARVRPAEQLTGQAEHRPPEGAGWSAVPARGDGAGPDDGD